MVPAMAAALWQWLDEDGRRQRRTDELCPPGPPGRAPVGAGRDAPGGAVVSTADLTRPRPGAGGATRASAPIAR